MRYVVVGSGAVGGSIGFLLAEAGLPVLLVARGEHGAAIRTHGLRLRLPTGERSLRLPCMEDVSGAGINPSDVVLLCVKSQDAGAALAALPQGTSVVCAQNGVSTEALAQRSCSSVAGMMTWMPALHLEPGVVELYGAPVPGVLRLGGLQAAGAAVCSRLADDLSDAGFDAEAVPDVMAWKHGKLLCNLGNALDAYAIPDPDQRNWVKRAMAEAEACLRSAGIAYVPPRDLAQDMRERMGEPVGIGGKTRAGGSTWQSATRGTPHELEHINGWICELGRRLGLPTPINAAFLRLAHEATGPRSVPVSRLQALLDS